MSTSVSDALSGNGSGDSEPGREALACVCVEPIEDELEA